MRVIDTRNSRGNLVFVLLDNVTRITIQPKEILEDVEGRWYNPLSWAIPDVRKVDTGKWEIVVETSGGTKNTITRENEEEARETVLGWFST